MSKSAPRCSVPHSGAAVFQHPMSGCSLEDFDGEEIDEEALIEQRRQQRMAIVQVCM